MIAAASLLLIVMVLVIAGRIAAIALAATGLPVDVARFQSRSALTGVGFTTGESEMVVNHPARRRIVMVLMLVGNAGFVTIVASVMLSFVAVSGEPSVVLRRLLVILLGLALIGLFARSRFFEQGFTRLMARLVQRFTDLDLRDFHHLMQLTTDYAITELAVRPGDWLANRPLDDLQLLREGVLVLAIRRADGEFLGAPRGPTVVHAYDTLVLYGRAAVLIDLDVRPATPSGDEAHSEAVAEQEELLAEQINDPTDTTERET